MFSLNMKLQVIKFMWRKLGERKIVHGLHVEKSDKTGAYKGKRETTSESVTCKPLRPRA